MKTHTDVTGLNQFKPENSLLRRALFTAFYSLMSVLFCVSNTNASSITVQVLDHSNKPIEGAAVCLGRSTHGKEYGVERTDNKGSARFSVLPGTSFILTVSRSQYKGIQRTVSLGDVDLVRIIHSPRGGLGPACDAPPRLISSFKVMLEVSDSSLLVTDLKIDRGNKTTNTRRVVLNSKVTGNPTHYRISEDPEFADTKWMEYQKTPIYTLSNGQGPKTVYFQVRRAVEKDDGIIQILSNVSNDVITFRL